jgi:hypothetical protein
MEFCRAGIPGRAARAAPTWSRFFKDRYRTTCGLGAETSLLAGYHNPQGRAIALLRLVQLGADDVLAVLPRELVSVVAARLENSSCARR